MTLEIFFSYLFTVVISLIATPLVNKMGQKADIVAKENNRTIHHGRIARIGGVAIFISFMIGTCVFLKADRQINAILIAGFIIFMTGLVDDMIDLKPKAKLLMQIIAATIVIFYGDMYIHNIYVPFLPDNQILSTIVTFGWIVGVTNAINLIDGLDGLCAGVTSIVLVVTAFTAVTFQRSDIAAISILLAGAISGFLCYNFHPATIFMGDCGALFIGFMISVISILGFGSESTVFFTLGAPIVMLALPIMDTVIAILRRKLKHKRFDEADREHLHHTLMFKLDMGQTRSVIILYMATILFALSSYIYLFNRGMGLAIFICLVFAFEIFVEYTQIISVNYRPVLAILNIFIRSTDLPAFSKQRKKMELEQKAKEYTFHETTDVEILLEKERIKMRNKKQKNRVVGSLIALGLVVIGIAAFYTFPKEDDSSEIPFDQPVVPIEIAYKKSADNTPYMESLYDVLLESLEAQDAEKLKGYIAAYFTTDFFTWSNKHNGEDIGGLSYVLPDARVDFKKYAINYYYAKFEEQHQKPEVINSVVNSVTTSSFVYAKTGNTNSYDVNVTITFAPMDDVLPENLTANYLVTLLQENSIYYVVGIDEVAPVVIVE